MPTAIELATGYVQLVPSAKNIQAGLDKELGAPLEAAAKKAGDKAGKTLGSRLSKAAVKGTEALSAGVAGVAALAVKNGSALQESQDQLANAIENTGGAYKNQESAIRAVQKTGEGLGFTYAETNDALTNLTRSTGSSTKAIGLLGIAQDLSRAKHIALADAALAVAKASEGQLKPLKALGIDLPVAAGGAAKTAKAFTALGAAQGAQKVVLAAIHAGTLKGKAGTDALAKANFGLLKAQSAYNKVGSTGDQIIAGLGAKLSGTASTSADSFKGKIEVLHARFTDMTAQLGLKLIPILTYLGTKFGQLVTFFSQNHAALIALGIAVGLFVAAMVTMAIIDKVRKATEAWAVVQNALNISMGLFPAILIIAAIAALAAGVIYAYTHFKWFHDGVDKAWQILQSIFGWVKTNWPLIASFLAGPIGVAVFEIVKHWGAVSDGFHTAAITLGNIAIDAANAILWPFRQAFNAIADIWNNTIGGLSFHIPDWVPGIGGKGFTVPKIGHWDAIAAISNGSGAPASGGRGSKTRFADGGFVPGRPGQPVDAVVHGGELILNQRQQLSALLDGAGVRGARGLSKVADEVHFHVNDTRDAVREMSWMLYAGAA